MICPYSSFVNWFHVFSFFLVQDRIQSRVTCSVSCLVSGLESGTIPQPFFVFYDTDISGGHSLFKFPNSISLYICTVFPPDWFQGVRSRPELRVSGLRASQGTALGSTRFWSVLWEADFDSLVKRRFDFSTVLLLFFPLATVNKQSLEGDALKPWRYAPLLGVSPSIIVLLSWPYSHVLDTCLVNT